MGFTCCCPGRPPPVPSSPLPTPPRGQGRKDEVYGSLISEISILKKIKIKKSESTSRSVATVIVWKIHGTEKYHVSSSNHSINQAENNNTMHVLVCKHDMRIFFLFRFLQI